MARPLLPVRVIPLGDDPHASTNWDEIVVRGHCTPDSPHMAEAIKAITEFLYEERPDVFDEEDGETPVVKFGRIAMAHWQFCGYAEHWRELQMFSCVNPPRNAFPITVFDVDTEEKEPVMTTTDDNPHPDLDGKHWRAWLTLGSIANDILTTGCLGAAEDLIARYPDDEERARQLVQALLQRQGDVDALRARAEKAEANYAFMVKRAMDGADGSPGLDGYREMAARAAEAENTVAALRARLREKAEDDAV